MINIITYKVTYLLDKNVENNEEESVWITWSTIYWPSIILFAAPRTLFTGGRLRLSSTGYYGSCAGKTLSALANWPKRLASPAVPLQRLANAWKRPGW